MSPTPDLQLTPEMLLFEVACLCSRHGIAVPATVNPGAARYHAEGLLQALGIIEPPPAITAASAPVAELPRREPRNMTSGIPTITPSPLAPLRAGGQHRVLRLAPEGGSHA